MTRTWIAPLSAALIALSACGVTYNSPTVRSQAAGSAVRVINLTPQTVAVANRNSYRPRTLPAAFFQAAGGSGSGRGVGALPEQPVVPTERPTTLELRVPPEPADEPYRIGVGDVVLLAVQSTADTIQELSGLLAIQNQRQGFTVRDDGAIAIPEIGTVQLAGMTLEEAEARLFQVLVENQIDPAFSLEIAEFNSKRVTVGGSVAAPTLVPITLNTLNLGEAVTAAGGVTAPNEEYVSIRIYRDGNLYQIPLEDYLARPDLQRLELVNGDAVFVDTTYDLEQAFAFYQAEIDVINLRQQARQQALSELSQEISLRRAALDERRGNFSAQLELDAVERDYVYLAGEVSTQSRFTLPFGRQATLADVIYSNGGFETTTGDPAEIYVLRASENPAEFNAVTAWHLNAANAANLTLATQMTMRPNDIVFIEEQPITKWNRALQQFFPTIINTATSAVGN
ncbi:Polysaccharide biosynthesis/export protein [Roseivivax jejudonensis]|uniref:Polysaccharide biosynthesis/export protein n=1 Tax=Roseivivax jejudonensis TaxID=1529041 RepID=A0A1X7AAJ6_9RHOB|nr:polysaccharide biosynthesis/export family protein [Roseivivax jejudonensis]SLN74202.1 Polysaccharide biosynthesis/export protein [Roseivivax jejudonensis]